MIFKTTLREQIKFAREQVNDDSWWVHCSLSKEELDREFDHRSKPKYFILWTQQRVYGFAGDSIGSVPRNPVKCPDQEECLEEFFESYAWTQHYHVLANADPILTDDDKRRNATNKISKHRRASHKFEEKFNLSDPSIFEEIDKIYEEHKEPDWDGREAEPVNDITYESMKRLVPSLPKDLPNPCIEVYADGTLAFEWHPNIDNLISIGIQDEWQNVAVVRDSKIVFQSGSSPCNTIPEITLKHLYEMHKDEQIEAP